MASSRTRRSRRRRGRHRHRQQRPPSPGLDPRPGFDHEKALIIGVIEVLVGLVMAVLAVVAIFARAWGNRSGACFWGGACFVAAGVCGIAAARFKTNCSIALFLLLSAVSAALALVVLALAAIGVALDHQLLKDQQRNDGSALVVHSLVIVAALIESVCGALGAVVGCKAVCGGWYGTRVPLAEPQERVTSDHFIASGVDQDLLYPAARPVFMPYPAGPLYMPPEAYLVQPDGMGYGPVVYVMPPPPPSLPYPEAAPEYQLSSTPPPAYSTFDRRPNHPHPTTDDLAGDTDPVDDVNVSHVEGSTHHDISIQHHQQEPSVTVDIETSQSTEITDPVPSLATRRTDHFDGGWRTLPLAAPARVTPRTRPPAWPSRPSGRSVVTSRSPSVTTDRPASPKQRITAV